MIEIMEGDKRDIAVSIARTRGTGVFTPTNPTRRIVTAQRSLASSAWDWGTTGGGGCIWDATNAELYALFDATDTALVPGNYYMQLRCTIGTEIYGQEVAIRVKEMGP